MKNVNELLTEVKIFLKKILPMETKLEDMGLADGVTTIQAEKFEKDYPVFIVVPESEPIPLPVGSYELADGMILTVEVEGIIASVEMPVEENEPIEPTEVPVEAEKVQVQTTAKKIIKSTVEEQHFSKVENLESKVLELEAKIVELSKVKEVVEDVIELEEIKPIVFNPEMKGEKKPETPLEKYRAIKANMKNF
jgi:hypothetical protein